MRLNNFVTYMLPICVDLSHRPRNWYLKLATFYTSRTVIYPADIHSNSERHLENLPSQMKLPKSP